MWCDGWGCEEVSVKVSMCVGCDGVESTLWYIFLLISAGVQCSVWTCGQNEWREIKTISPPLT